MLATLPWGWKLVTVGSGQRRRARRGLVRVPLAGVLLLLLAGAISCGGGASGGTTQSNPGTPTGSYSLTVTATVTSGATTLKHNLTLTLNVQ